MTTPSARLRRASTMMAAVALATTMAAACAQPADPAATTIPVAPEFPEPEMPMAPDLTGRLQQALDGAAARGATLSIGFLDRETGTYMGSGDNDPIETASVVKLFIADDLLYRSSRGEFALDEESRALIAPMLSSSDDSAAQVLWDAAGGSDVVARVAGRYGLPATAASADGIWWNTRTTAADLVRYYDAVLDGTGGLNPADRATVVGDLEAFTPEGADGYPQTFGIPRALPGETVRGVKQGWMCCVDGRWIHLSTGFVGDGERYVVAVLSREDPWYGADGGSAETTADTAVTDDDGAKHARVTVTGALKILFPTGVVA
ncbi:serine hydrolase [Rhodococcus sp. BP-316]|uniref:serine hydrolase n=1 Tax=Rhodococcus sp. BP-316 TaxID=2739445 RepID=UPI0027E0AE81|nr:serine hydrolase [Rhodococcus sp. BP-316]